MTASKPTILLRPRCPDPDDPEILQLLDLACHWIGVSWVELELRLEAGPTQKYQQGTADCEGISLDITSDGFEATLRLGSDASPDDRLVEALSYSLDKILLCRRYHEQVTLLRGALDTTTSAVLLFDRHGGIVYANPPADRLLSRQTEDGLLVEWRGKKNQPLMTFLCSTVEEVASNQNASTPWTGTLALSDGSVVACEILQVEAGSPVPTAGVIALLQPVPALSKLCLQSFCTRYRLSPREEDVVRLLLEGLTTNGVADRLNISLHTVRDHIKRLYRKTGARSRSELLSLVSTAGTSTQNKSAH